MTPADAPPSSAPEAPPSAQDRGDWQRLRSLLLSGEQASLSELAAKVGNRDGLARSVAGVLSEAAAIRARQDDSFAQVLSPVIEQSLQESVRRSPQPLVDALYPIMGPAIRRSIAEALSEMMQTFNRAVEQSLSPRALKWRLDAWRTGQSYASVVLLKTLIYRVEQVFLIHRETGLLLAYAQADQVIAHDPDMVSGMLTAIRDFVGDSFHVSHEDGVDAIRIGDLTVQIRVGPKAVLAAVVRGSAPESLRVQLSETLEGIHRTYGTALNEFNGNSASFADAARWLQSCLSLQTRARDQRSSWGLYLGVASIAALLGWWAFAHYRAAIGWNAVVEELEREPGLFVVRADGYSGHRLRGLRDPLARDPENIVGAERMRRYAIEWTWKPYLSMEPALLLVRARQLVKPPDGVQLSIDGDVLRASGTAPASWVREVRSRATFVPGIRAVDLSAVTLNGEVTLEQARRTLGSMVLYFEPGSDVLSEAQRIKLDSLQPSLSALRDAGAALQIDYSLEIVGRADAPGTTALNLHLSQSRADMVRQYLIAHGVPSQRVHARGIGWLDADSGGRIDSLDTERRVNLFVTAQ